MTIGWPVLRALLVPSTHTQPHIHTHMHTLTFTHAPTHYTHTLHTHSHTCTTHTCISYTHMTHHTHTHMHAHSFTLTTCICCTHRYNISTADYDAWDGATNSSIERRTNVRVFNGDTNNFVREEVSDLDVYSQYGFSREEALQVSANIRGLPCDIVGCECHVTCS